MKKLWMLPWANLKKTKSVSVTLGVIFIVAALLLNTGLLVSLNYPKFFDEQKEELQTSDGVILMSKQLYTDEIKTYLKESKHVKKIQENETLILTPKIKSQGKMKDYTVFFRNMDEQNDISKWKYVGEHLPVIKEEKTSSKQIEQDMPVYIPDVFKTVSGYQLDDKIKLKYTDENNKKKTLTFTVKGYIEDIYFCSPANGPVSFYLTGDSYRQMGKILDHPAYEQQLLFVNLDKITNLNKIENDLREKSGLFSSSMISADAQETIMAIDVELEELARCMMASMLSAMMVVFALIIVIVCLLVVRFRITNSIEDDLMKIGSLKSIGYTSHQIIVSVLLQFSSIAILGSLLGIALSYPILPLISKVFEQQSGLMWEQGFDGLLSFTALGIIMSIAILVSVLAARKIKKLSPVRALRGDSGGRKYKRNMVPLEKSVGGLSTSLAFKSILQNLRQSFMVLFIVIAVSFVGAFGIIMYYNSSVDTRTFAEAPGAEICNAFASLKPDKDQTQTIKDIEDMPTVRKAQCIDEAKLKVEDIDTATNVMSDYAGKESIFVYEGRYPEKSGEIELAGILSKRLNKTIGDVVKVSFGDTSKTFTVVGISNGNMNSNGFSGSILAVDMLKLNPKFKATDLYIYLDDGTDASKFVKKLEKEISDKYLAGAIDFDKAFAEGMSAYQSIVAAMGLTMLVVTMFVIALVLYFVIGSLIVRRRRDLGIQKAIGFSTGQLVHQISIGFGIPVAIGVATGSLLGALYTNSLMSLFMKGMGIMRANFIVDPLYVLGFGILIFVFAYVLSLLITLRIRKISAYALATE